MKTSLLLMCLDLEIVVIANLLYYDGDLDFFVLDAFVDAICIKKSTLRINFLSIDY